MNKKIINGFMICLLLTIIYFMITASDTVIESVSFSISIWKDNLFPTLFPFFVVSNLLLNYGFVDIIGNILAYPMNKFYHLPGSCGFVLAISLVSGFPSGAKYTKDLVDNNLITNEQAERLLTFTHYSNPLFILGMIGNILLNNQSLAYLIMLAHVISGLLVGIIFRKKENNNLDNKKLIKSNNKPFGNLLTTSISNSLNTMFLLLGVVTIFLIVSSLIKSFFNLQPLLNTLISGILEMTQGVKNASLLNISELSKAMIITGIISFGGLSVHMQVISIISENKIRYKYFLFARILHSIIAIILISIFYLLYINL